MSINCQLLFDVTANDLIEKFPSEALLAREIAMVTGEHDKPHSHQWHQLIYPRKGLLRTKASMKQYFVPYNRAVLIPASCVHESWAITSVEFVGLYINPSKMKYSINQCKIIEVSALFREIIGETIKIIRTKASRTKSDNRIIQVFYDQLSTQSEAPLEVILPKDKRLNIISDHLLNNPACKLTLPYWANKVGASERTISRLFEVQTGLTYKKWRQRLRLVSSLSQLENKVPIQMVAYNVGYSSSSAYIHSFKNAFNITPQQYMFQLNK